MTDLLAVEAQEILGESAPDMTPMVNDQVSLLLHRASAWARLGDYHQAVEDSDLALALAPHRIRVNGGLVQYEADTGNIVGGANTATPSVDAPGTYTLTVTGVNGCTDTDTDRKSEV